MECLLGLVHLSPPPVRLSRADRSYNRLSAFVYMDVLTRHLLLPSLALRLLHDFDLFIEHAHKTGGAEYIGVTSFHGLVL